MSEPAADSSRVEVILEIDGADLGPEEVLRGVAQFLEESSRPAPALVFSTAHPGEIRDRAERILPEGAEFEILHALDQLPEDIESPMQAFREHRRNSITEAMKRAKDNPESCVLCPGDTGLVMAAALFTLGRVEGVERPPIGVPFPSRKEPFLLADGGSNVDVRPEHLVQFAVVASVFTKEIWDRATPKVGLLSNGTEEYKGNELVRKAHGLLKDDPRVNFHGYIEGNTLFNGGIDVVVCDGFVGNIVLKSGEGIARAMTSLISSTLREHPIRGLLAKWLLGPIFGEIRQHLDYSSYGGAPLLGVDGNVIICHGRSDATAFQNAMRVGTDLTESGVLERIHTVISEEMEKSQTNSQTAGEVHEG